MEYRNLKTFLQIADCGSFTAAAETLGYTQSTVSFQIRQLETELGCMLFDRIGKRIVLTEDGKKLLAHAVRVEHDMLGLTEAFREEGEPEGTVHMFCADSVCEKMMRLNYHDFYARYPGIRLTFSTGDTVDLLRTLDENTADVIFTLDSHVSAPQYVTARESPVALWFVTGAESPLAGRKDVSVEELLAYPFLLTEKGMSYHRLLDERLAERGLEVVPVLETGRTDIIVSCLEGTDAIGFLPEFVAERAVNEGRLARIDVKDMQLTIWKQLICHRDKWLSRPLAEFIEYVKAHEFEW